MTTQDFETCLRRRLQALAEKWVLKTTLHTTSNSPANAASLPFPVA
jgi:hypothetical protein